MKHLLIVAAAGAIAWIACSCGQQASTPPPAQSPGGLAAEAVASIAPQAAIETVAPAPLHGFQQVVAGGQVVYVSNDGRYLLQGALYDVKTKQNLNDAAMSSLRRQILDTIPEHERIVFSPPDPKYTVVVFTDIECGYCRRFHEDIAAYNAAGIRVEYVAFPRAGVGSADYAKMVSVWCSSNRSAAMSTAKAGQSLPEASCANPVATQYEKGIRAGLMGTPMILAPDGTQLGGYLPPADLLAALQSQG